MQAHLRVTCGTTSTSSVAVPPLTAPQTPLPPTGKTMGCFYMYTCTCTSTGVCTPYTPLPYLVALELDVVYVCICMHIFIYLYILLDTCSSGAVHLLTAPQTPLPPTGKTMGCFYRYLHWHAHSIPLSPIW